jgi:subtilisin-like proprotein convertase family protein
MKTNFHFARPSAVLFAVLLAVASPFAEARAGTVSTNWSGGQAIPDNDPDGVAFAFNLSVPEPDIITNVTVDLNISGGWNGDLYAYLSHGSGFVVLLNRIGSTASNPGGSGVSGMNVELSDSYLTDVHLSPANPLTGDYAPDGRNVSPLTALNTDPRTAFFSSFDGLDPTGGWTLFFADVSPLEVSTIQSWSVNVGVTVPEPSSFALAVWALGLAFLGCRLKVPGCAKRKTYNLQPSNCNPRA